MQYFTSNNSISKVERQVYTGSKSVLTDLLITATCYFRPLSEEQASLNNFQWGQAFQMITETSVDIRQGDRITVDSVVYLVRGMSNHNRGGFTSYKKYLCVLPEA